MLSYPVAEAEELLTTKLATAQKSHSNCEEDLEFLREQITVRPPLFTIQTVAKTPNTYTPSDHGGSHRQSL